MLSVCMQISSPTVCLIQDQSLEVWTTPWKQRFQIYILHHLHKILTIQMLFGLKSQEIPQDDLNFATKTEQESWVRDPVESALSLWSLLHRN